MSLRTLLRFAAPTAVAALIAAVAYAGEVHAKQLKHAATTPYIEQSLVARTGTLSVIVMSNSSRDAADAVRVAGGTITSDLWIANAVAAQIPRESLAQLSRDLRVRSVVENKKVRGAGEYWNGWMSDDRLVKGTYLVDSSLYATPIHLPNGGFASVTQNGQALLVNPDGSEKARITLPLGAPFYAPIFLGPDQTLYALGAYGSVYALNLDGKLLWQNATMLNTDYWVSNGVFGSDGTLYLISYNGVAYALDPATGNIRWKQTLVTKKGAAFWAPPVLGTDDTMYVQSVGGDVFAITAAGVRWSAYVNGSSNTNTLQKPVLNAGLLYIASGSQLVAFDITTGSQRMSFATNTTTVGSPAVTPDGTSIFVASATTVYSVSSTGTMRWAVNSPLGGYSQGPVLSADGLSVYIQAATTKGKKSAALLGINRSSGSIRFNDSFNEGFVSQLAVDPDGGILVGDSSGNIYRLANDGTISHRLKLHASIVMISQASDTGNIIAVLGGSVTELDFIGRLPNEYNGRKDVEPINSNSRQTFHLVYPVVLDVGADVLHLTTLPSGAKVTGGDVVVAVVDSGVYWDSETRSLMGATVQHQFLGQADYIQSQCSGLTGCTQYPDYAFFDYNTSKDTFGHGTHIAGTILNQLTDDRLPVGVYLGVAPTSRVLSVRVLDGMGNGSYETVMKGIQYVVANKNTFNVRVLNLSLSSYATVPYFVDPLNRAVERAWASGIVVVAAAGNIGPFAQTVTVPGNDPYVITVGAVNGGRTPSYWKDDIVPLWSSTGPTYDGFVKPDVVAPGSQIVSYMFNGGLSNPDTAYLVRVHPDYSVDTKLFRMNGTSMATGVASGVVALMLQVNPSLTPDQVKYRLAESSRSAQTKNGDFVYNTLQQGLGRVWAPDAVLSPIDPAGVANLGMDVNSDLAHGYDTLADLSYHYQGPVQSVLSDDGTANIFYATDSGGNVYELGATDLTGRWLDADFAQKLTSGGTRMLWAGGLSWSGDSSAFNANKMGWSATRMIWAGWRGVWGGTRMIWAGTRMLWAGGLDWKGGQAWGVTRMIWAGSTDPGSAYGATRMIWAGAVNGAPSASNSHWIEDNWLPPAAPEVPPPAGANH